MPKETIDNHTLSFDLHGDGCIRTNIGTVLGHVSIVFDKEYGRQLVLRYNAHPALVEALQYAAMLLGEELGRVPHDIQAALDQAKGRP